MTAFPHAERLDAPALSRRLAEATGTALAYDGPCPGGQVGAAYVRHPDGRRAVLTRCQPGTLDSVRRTAELLAVARVAGVPAPRYELVAEVPGAMAVVQELLPGTPPVAVRRRTIESMVEVNRRCRGLLTGRDDLPSPSLHLREDGPGFCLHEPLARYDRRTARLAVPARSRRLRLTRRGYG